MRLAQTRVPYLVIAFVCVLAIGAAGEPESSPSTTSDSPPTLGLLDASLEDGLVANGPHFHPGKLDLLLRRRPDRNEYNLIAWSPFLKGGLGMVDVDSVGAQSHAGAYVRPLLACPDVGELIIGAQGIEPEGDGGSSFELQGEYRLPSRIDIVGGFGVGGGLVERIASDEDVGFAKVTYRDTVGDWSYILALVGQEMSAEADVGGYAALYDDIVMLVGGTDGEQWRATAGAVAPENDTMFRPALEALWVDQRIGEADGPRFLFVNGTLRFGKGFLSHPARLGRAMGPQGVEFGNPLGFLRPTWNRRLDVWELGGSVDYRWVRTEAPDGGIAEKHELVVYPFSFAGAGRCLDGFFGDLLDGLFVSGSYARAVENTPGFGIGFCGAIGFLNVSAVVEYETETDGVTALVGVIDGF